MSASSQQVKDEVMWKQRFLLTGGYKPGKVDGIEGPKTRAAWDEFVRDSILVKAAFDSLDRTSESKLLMVAISVQRMARQIVRIGRENGIDVRFSSGMRTFAEQDYLYAQGRTRKGQIVTNAKGGSSMHNYGRAVDVVIYEKEKPTWVNKPYDELARVVKSQKLKTPELRLMEWGGDWRFVDRPHYQITGGKSTAQIKTAFNAGKLLP